MHTVVQHREGSVFCPAPSLLSPVHVLTGGNPGFTGQNQAPTRPTAPEVLCPAQGPLKRGKTKFLPREYDGIGDRVPSEDFSLCWALLD